MTTYGFANRLTAKRGYAGVWDRETGQRFQFATKEEATEAMKKYARRVRANERDFIVLPFADDEALK